jgi:3-deoxy-7-phosphoheptulonate synthase
VSVPGVWTPDSWRKLPNAQEFVYDDVDELDACVARLGELPPLVTSWEIERIKSYFADAQEGRRFVLQGGDCAETLSDCRPEVIAAKLKILLQMSLVLVHGGHRPVVRVGRFAGQYAKPRSSPTETRNGQELPSYFGDLVNRPAFLPDARRVDPKSLLRGYEHAALTLNFVRSLGAGGFADVHHPEYWEMSFFRKASLPEQLRDDYEQMTRRLSEALRFMEALGEGDVEELTRVEFFTSHEGLNLHYESAQTRPVPRRRGHYDLTVHFPWIGERTRQLDGAHIEFFRGISNPIGVKVGPSTTGDDLLRLAEVLDPENEPGKLVIITRMGASRVSERLPELIRATKRAGRRILWISDPMHGNTKSTTAGIKTRNFDDILREVEATFDVHDAENSYLGGVHFELTGEDVTECTGGAAGITEQDLDKNYASLCDPRLNYRQALEMSFRIAKRMRAGALGR